MDAYPEDFKIAVELVLNHEGGYSNHAADSGGATNFGITEKALKAFYDHKYPHPNIRDLTKDQALYFYLMEYWKPLRLSEFPSQALKNVVLATAVNMGKVPAIQKLQTVLMVPADGKVGPRTLGALNNIPLGRGDLAAHVSELVNYYCDEIENFYERLVERRPKDRVFLKGWKNRIGSFRMSA